MRLPANYWEVPRFHDWSGDQKWAFSSLIGYCARHGTGGTIPACRKSLPRGITPKLLAKAEIAGWLERDEHGQLRVREWNTFCPADPTGAERMRRYRLRQRAVTQP